MRHASIKLIGHIGDFLLILCLGVTPPLPEKTPVSSEQDKTDKGALAMVRRDYAPFLTTLIAEIRQRN